MTLDKAWAEIAKVKVLVEILKRTELARLY